MMKQKEFSVVKDRRVTCEKDHHQEISKQKKKTREEKLFDIKNQFLWGFSYSTKHAHLIRLSVKLGRLQSSSNYLIFHQSIFMCCVTSIYI